MFQITNKLLVFTFVIGLYDLYSNLNQVTFTVTEEEVKAVPSKILVKRFYGNNVTVCMSKDRDRYRLAILKRKVQKE